MAKLIKRFSKPIVISHWINAVTYALLLLSGFFLFTTSFDAVAFLFGGETIAKRIHRIAAVFFILGPIVAMINDFPGFKQWIRESATWTKEDFEFLKGFGKEFFGNAGDAAPQGFFNAGQKLNSVVIIVGSGILAFTGLFLWVGPNNGFSGLMLILHDITMLMTTAAAMGHAYMGLLHPQTSKGLSGMVTGYITEEYAEEHHGKWYAQEKEQL